MKSVLVSLLGLFVYLPSQAMLQYSCDIWSLPPAEPISLEANGILSGSLGDTGKNREVHPSTMILISTQRENNTKAQELVFNDSFSTSNIARVNGKWGAGGSFNVIEKKIRPVTGEPGNIKIEEEVVKVRELTFFVNLLPDNGFTALSVNVKQSTPDDAHFLGRSEFTRDGKTYKDLRTNCYVSIGWDYYKAKK